MSTIKIKRGSGTPPLLADGEIAFDKSGKSLFVSDGTQNIEFKANPTTANIPDSTNKRYVSDAKLAVLNTTTGINTGNQTSIVGISGTKVQFNSAVTDGDLLYVGDVTQYTDEMAQDAVGNMVTDTSTVRLTYNDGANSMYADVLPDSINVNHLASGTPLSKFVNNVGFEGASGLTIRDNANRSRANHTGTQLANTISDFNTSARTAAVEDLLVDGVTDKAPSQHTVLNALALKSPVQLNQLIKTKRNIQDVVNDVGNRQVRWAIFGDSMATTKSQFILPHLNNIIGFAGAFGSGNWMGITNNSGSTETIQDYSLYPFTMKKVASGNNYSFGLFGGNVTADVWKIYYINNGASFKIQIDAIDNTTVNTTNDGTISVATINTSLASHSINIVCLSGNVYLPLCGMYDSTISGVIPIYTNEGGNDLSNWIQNDLALDNLAFIYADLGVNLWSFEMKEIITDLQFRITKLFNKIDEAIPDADKLIFTTTPVQNDTTGSQESNNVITRKEAIDRNYNLFDCFKKVGSYENLVDNNWQGDGTHPSEDCQKWLANEFLNDFNLLTVGVEDSPFGIFSTIKAKKVKLGRAIEVYEEPNFQLDGVVKVKRFLEITNKNNSVTFRLDLGDYTNSSSGDDSVLPKRFKLGDSGLYLISEFGKLVVKNVSDNSLANFEVKTIQTDNMWLKGMTTIQINAISAPQDGLMVYNSDLSVLCFYGGTGWKKISHSAM